MLVQFGNNWIQKIPLTAKLDSAYGLVQFWLSSDFFSSNYFQIGQHVVLLHINITCDISVSRKINKQGYGGSRYGGLQTEDVKHHLAWEYNRLSSLRPLKRSKRPER